MQYNLGLKWMFGIVCFFSGSLLYVLRSTQLTKYHQTQFCAV